MKGREVGNQDHIKRREPGGRGFGDGRLDHP